MELESGLCGYPIGGTYNRGEGDAIGEGQIFRHMPGQGGDRDDFSRFEQIPPLLRGQVGCHNQHVLDSERVGPQYKLQAKQHKFIGAHGFGEQSQKQSSLIYLVSALYLFALPYLHG